MFLPIGDYPARQFICKFIVVEVTVSKRDQGKMFFNHNNRIMIFRISIQSETKQLAIEGNCV